MSTLYRNKKWLDFHREVIELDGHQCSVCHRKESDGIILQVHHKHYVAGKHPWEYNYNDCETLCKGCHAREHGLIIPNSGWHLVCDEDLGELNASCELCGTSLRYVFTIHHPHWEPLNVGTDCCDRLTGTKVASEFMDEKKRYIERLNRFLKSSRWKLNKRNNLVIHQKDFDIEIIETSSGFKLWIDEFQGKNTYQSVNEAKEKVFSIIESGEAEKYIMKKRYEKNFNRSNALRWNA